MANNQPVGVMQIVLTSNNASFSAGIAEAQRKLDAFSKTATGAGHSTVSSMQSASAAIRLLENPLGNNIRAIERLVSQSKVLSEALKVAFPFVGAIAGGMIIAKLGEDVAKFIKTVQDMPKAIKQGFGALNLEQKTATDELILRTDELRNSIAKLQGKNQDNLKIALDEERLAADRLAASITNANSKLNELLSKNHLSGFALLLGKVGTSERQGTAKAFSDQADSNAYDLANAAPGSPAEAKAKKALKDTQTAQLAEARQDLAKRLAVAGKDDSFDDSANINIDKGVITTILNAQKQQNAQVDAAQAEADQKKQEAANAAIEAAKKASALRLQAMVEALAQEKTVQNVSVKQEFDYWSLKISTFSSKSKEYGDIVKMQASLAMEGARKAAEAIKQFRAQQLKGTGGEGDEIVARGAFAIQRDNAKSFGEQNQEGIDSNQLAIVNAHNTAREREAQVNDAAGRSMSRYAAAVQLAQVHAQEFLIVMTSLQSILSIRQRAFDLDPTKENAKGLEDAKASVASAGSQRSIQLQGDADNIYGRQTSAAAGAADALRDFTLAATDAYTQMRNLITTTQSTINEQIIRGISGQRTDFGNAGAGIFRSVASTGLQKAEGSVLGLFGLGGSKKPTGTKGDPLYVQMATIDAHNAVNAGAAGLIQGITQSGSTSGGSSSSSSAVSSLAGIALKAFPMFAGGGAIGADQWAIVGEKGPELFHSGPGGNITPNNKVSVGGGGGHTFNIDATGATDPAQTEAAVRRGIAAATPHIQAGAVRAMTEHRLRRPSTSR